MLAVLGTAVTVTLAVLHAHQTDMGWLALVQPGTEGLAADVFAEDFPDVDLQGGIGHDGQYFYVAARSPTDPELLSEHIGRPRYRLQRPLFPALAWALHPTGGGYGLLTAMVVVGAGSLLLLGMAAGLLSVQLGGPALPAAVIPLLPGSLWSFRLGLADNLALALALLGIWAVHRRATGVATALGVGAVLAKEAMLVLLVAKAAADRRRESVIPAAVATCVAAAWWFALRSLIETSGRQVLELTWPFGGMADNLDQWLAGEELLASTSVAVTLVLSVGVLVHRGRRHPLFGPLLGSLAFTTVLSGQVLGLDHNGSRTIAPALVLAILVAVTPAASDPGGRDVAS